MLTVQAKTMARGMKTVLLWGIVCCLLLSFCCPPAFAEEVPHNEPIPEQVGTDDATNPNFLTHYEEVARNAGMAMYADLEKGHFAVVNLESGKIWYSTPNDAAQDTLTKGVSKMNLQSQLIVNYLYRSDENSNMPVQSANSQSVINAGNITVDKLLNGIRVTYRFAELGFTIPVEYVIENGYIQATIDLEHLDEGEICYLVGIQLLPAMGAGNSTAEGYLFIPDGCGAVVPFNSNVPSLNQYEQMVYGDDPGIVTKAKVTRKETIRMPVFGTVSGQDALLGVITQGDSAASIVAYNGNSTTGYNAVSSKLNLKIAKSVDSFYKTNESISITQLTHTPINMDKYQVRYYPLCEDKANYVGMAECYRNYLIADKGLRQNPQPPAFSLDIYGSVDMLGNFIGITYNKQEALTTYRQAAELVTSLRDAGIGILSVRYLGWQDGGVLNTIIPAKAAASGLLGGDTAFAELGDYLAENGIAFYPDVDPIRYRDGGNGVNLQRDSAKTPYGSPALQHEYLRSVYEINLNIAPYRLLRPSSLLQPALNYADSYLRLEQDAVSLGTVGSMVYSDFAKDAGVYRSQLPAIYRDLMEKYSGQDVALAFAGGNAYVLPYAQRIYEAPVDSSSYDIFQNSVPFYQIVLHGFTTLTVPEILQSVVPVDTYLKAVETGSELLYAGIYESCEKLMGTRYEELYSSTYTMWRDTAAKQYAEYRELLEQVYGLPITTHQYVQENVACTTFGNRISVLVNYNNEPVRYKGKTVGGKQFLFWEGSN